MASTQKNTCITTTGDATGDTDEFNSYSNSGRGGNTHYSGMSHTVTDGETGNSNEVKMMLKMAPSLEMYVVQFEFIM